MWGAPFIYGTDDPDSLLIKHGFSSNIIIAKYGDDNVNYGRFPRHLKDLLNVYDINSSKLILLIFRYHFNYCLFY